MRKWLDKTTALVLCSALVLAACGGDDDEAAPVEPEPEPVAEITPEIIGLYGTVVSSFQTIFFAALIPGTTSVPGAGGGSVEIAGNDWTLNEYSPDGALIVSGALNVGIDQTPIPLTGTGYPCLDHRKPSWYSIWSFRLRTDGLSSTGTITIDGTQNLTSRNSRLLSPLLSLLPRPLDSRPCSFAVWSQP